MRAAASLPAALASAWRLAGPGGALCAVRAASSVSGEQAKWRLLQEQGHDVNPCNSRRVGVSIAW